MLCSVAPGVLPDEVSRDPRAGAWQIKITLNDGLGTAGAQAALQALDQARRSFTARIDGRLCGTATVAVGRSFFDKAQLGDAHIPRGLLEVPTIPGISPEPIDVIVYAFSTADSLAATLIQDIQRIPGIASVSFERGYQRSDEREAFGQRDGLRNVRSADRRRIVFVDPDRAPDEPAWTAGGTYMAALKIEQNTTTWASLNQDQQNAVIGRRPDGSRLDQPEVDPNNPTDFHAEPGYADPNTPPGNSHIRKTGPHGTDGENAIKVFRRGAPYIEWDATGIHHGLHFVSYQDSLLVFDVMLNRWMFSQSFPQIGTGVDALVDPGRALTTIKAGSFYFALPDDPDRYLGAGIFDEPDAHRIVTRLTVLDNDGNPAPDATPEGATFALTDAGGNPIGGTLTTDATGRAWSDPIPTGTEVTITQTGAAPRANLAEPPTQGPIRIGCRGEVTDWTNKLPAGQPPNQYR